MGVEQPLTKRIFFSFVFVLLIVLSAEAQKYDFKVYSVNEGLPQGQVRDIYQTSDGFIWMATNGGGLSRFDGQDFKTYTTEDGLRNNAVQQIFEDSRGNVWVANYPGGVVRFQGDSLVNPFPDHALSNFEVWRIKELRDDEIWFGTYQGGIFILEEGEIRRLTSEDGLVSNSIWDFKEDEDGRIWITTQEGISVLDGDSVTNYTTEDGLSGNKVYRITEDQKGNKWFATDNGLTIWDGNNFRTITTINGISLDYVYDVKTASDGKVWIGTENKGVFVYDGEEYIHYTRNNGLSSNYIYAFFEDANKNMWITTDENGANLYRGEAFVFYDKEVGFSSNEVLSLLVDSDNVLWSGTTEGIESYDGKQVRRYSLPGEYENNYIWEIEELPNGNLLFLMPDYTLMEFDGQQFTNFTADNGLQKWFVYDLFVDSNNVLWIATDEGLYQLEEDGLNHFTTEDGLVGNIVHYVDEGRNGELLIGTNEGLSILSENTFKNIRIGDGLAHNSINYITQDSKNNIWLGTDSGVSLLEPNAENDSFSITNFGREEGMDLLATHFLWFDGHGYLWQGTNGGLNRMDVTGYWETGEMNLKHYALSDDGLGVEFNFKAIAMTDTNTVWFGSMDGALRLDVSELYTNELNDPPKVHITGINRNSRAVEWKNYTTDLDYKTGSVAYPEVAFPPGEHTYTFSFVGLDYRHPENVRYRYKMKGFEDEWMPVTSSNSATYTNLEPGNYTFMVQALNSSQKPEEAKTASYSFSVAFPFWQTYWFYGLVVLSLAGLVYGYIKIRLGFLEKHRLKELVDEQTKDLQQALGEKEVLIKEIHHRVKNTLAVISGLLELQRGYAEDEFSSRVLSESQRRVQSISMIHEKLYQNEQLAEINFEKYVRELVDIIAYSFNYNEKEIKANIDIDDFKLGVDQGIPSGLILNELVSNAYEHAFADQTEGTIEISMKRGADDIIRLTVADNGKGLPDGFDIGQNDTLGLTLIETLSAQLDGSFTFENTDKGARFELEFQKEKASEQIPTR